MKIDFLQFGSRNNFSNANAIITFTENVLKISALDNNKSAGGVFIDMTLTKHSVQLIKTYY